MKRVMEVGAIVALLAVSYWIKWKHDHPPFTVDDSSERALLLRASQSGVAVIGVAGVKIASADWNALLKEFRLNGLTPFDRGKIQFWAAYKKNGRIEEHRAIRYNPCTRRAQYSKLVYEGKWEIYELHPTTVKDLEYFLSHNAELQRKVEEKRDLEGITSSCP